MDPTSFRMFMAAPPVSSAAEPAIGDSYEGGFFAGYISQNADGVATHRLIVAPKSSGQSGSTLTMHSTQTSPSVTTTVYDGETNTSNWVTFGNSPACSYATGLSIGGYSDWYIAARYEMQIVYYHLKPSTASNVTNRGANAYSVPILTSDYTTTDPGQTSVSAFQSGGTEAFDTAYYWCSSIGGGGRVHRHQFNSGNVQQDDANDLNYVRAIRKEAV